MPSKSRKTSILKGPVGKLSLLIIRIKLCSKMPPLKLSLRSSCSEVQLLSLIKRGFLIFERENTEVGIHAMAITNVHLTGVGHFKGLF